MAGVPRSAIGVSLALLMVGGLLVLSGPGAAVQAPSSAVFRNVAESSTECPVPTPEVGSGSGCAAVAAPGSPTSLERSNVPLTGGTPTATRNLDWGTVVPPTIAAGSGAGFSADAIGEQAVLFGGDSGGTLSATTQVYNESTDSWATVSPVSAPSPRADFAFASDDADRSAVLYGGLVTDSTLRVDNSTWIYNFPAESWANVTTALAPPAREDAAFAVDPTAGFGLLYGGWNPSYSATSSLTYSDLWKFSFAGDTWSELSPTGPAPGALQGAMFAWDPTTGTFLLYGGCYPCTSTLWSYNATTNAWTLLPPASGTVPSARADGAWAWDPVDAAAVLFGGTNGVSEFNDSFEYLPGTNAWIEQATSVAPTERSNSAAAWLDVPGNETLVLSGGNGPSTIGADLWRLAPTANLSVFVENAQNSQPLGAARVLVDGTSLLSTGSSGYLNLTQVDPVATVLNVSRLGFADQQNAFWLTPASSTSVSFALAPVAPAVVDVEVVENGTGAPLAGVGINLTVEGVVIGGGNLSTDTEGFVNYSAVPSAIPAPLAVIVCVSPENYTESLNFSLLPGSVHDLVIVLTEYPQLHFQVTGLLASLAVVPLVNANVTENGSLIGRTSATGWLNVTSADPMGNVTLTLSAQGFSTLSQPLVLPRSGILVRTFQLVGLPYGRFQITVFAAGTTSEVLGSNVTATSDTAVTSVAVHTIGPTHLIGGASLSLPPGYYWLNASAYGYHGNNSTSLRALRSNQVISLVMNLTLEPGTNISLRVRAAGDGPPLSGVKVVSTGIPANLTSRSGWANFSNVHFGPAQFNESLSGYENNTTLVLSVPYGGTVDYFVTLTPLPPGPGGSGNLTVPFGQLFPNLGMIWPYLVVLGVTVAGALVYLLALQVAPAPPPENRAAPPEEERFEF